MSDQTSRLSIIIDSSGAQKNAENLTSALVNMGKAGDKATESTENLSEATKDYNSWLKQGPKLTDDVTKSTQAATKATNDEAKALGALLDKINPINAALNRLDDQQQALSKFKSKGMLDEETFTEYSARIDQARSKLTGFAEALTKTGDTSRHAAHNMAMIPSQLSWMVTSIASGQSPIMALVQQGSMLSGMMGGLGPTIKAVGAYLTGLINPFTAAAAAVGVLGLAYYQGEQEQEAFKKSLILTGNQVGKTSGQLSEMAASISTATGATQGQAASVIAQVVSTGTIAGDSLQKVSAAIVSMSDATGQATDSLVADFNNIANDPVAAITKLNDQYHFLTLATYNQIKALQDEGNQQDAAKVATDSYADAMNSRAKDIHESLGYLETAWDTLGNAAKHAWDNMLSVGRADTLQDKLSAAQSRLSNASAGYTRDIWGNVTGRASSAGADVNVLQSAVNLQNDLSGAISSANASTQRQITLQQQADKDGEQFATAAEKRAKAINLENTYLKAGVITLDQYNSRVSRIDQMYKDPAAPKQTQGRAYTEDAGSRLLDQINQQTASLITQLNTTEKISSVTQQRVKFEQQIADLKTKSQLTADQKSLLANADEIDLAYKRQETLQSQVTTLDDYRKMQEQVRSKDQQQNDLLTERLKLLDKAKAAGATDTDKTRADIYKNTPENMPSSVTMAIRNLQPTGGQLSGTFAGLSSQYSKLDKAQKDLQDWLKNKEDAYAKAGDITQAGEDRMNKIRQNAANANQQIDAQKSTIITTSTQSMMDSTVSIMQDGFGKQSVVYRAAFAADKAYAIAQSIVSINGAIAKAANWGSFPANLIAMASIAAQTASIVSNISAVSATGFQSGGYTGNGGVSDIAGVVHGQEFVMDAAATKRIGVSNLEAIRKNGLDATLSRSGFGTGAKTVSNKQSNVTHVTIQSSPITINGNPSDTTIQLVQQAARQGAQQGYKMVAGDLAAGKGQVHKSLTTGYKTSRRTG